MASKRQLRWRSCEKKIKHNTQPEAVAHLIRLKRKGGQSSTYKCKFCGGWHVGRQSMKKRQAIDQRLDRKR